jgi:putative FmdB family regulatory protein
MPLFDYECEKCGHVTEFLENAESKKVHRCEQCGSTRMKKMLSAFSVRAESGSSSGGSSPCPTGTCSLS